MARSLTAGDGRSDSVSNLNVDFEIWSKLHDLSREVAPDVSTFRGEEPVS